MSDESSQIPPDIQEMDREELEKYAVSLDQENQRLALALSEQERKSKILSDQLDAVEQEKDIELMYLRIPLIEDAKTVDLIFHGYLSSELKIQQHVLDPPPIPEKAKGQEISKPLLGGGEVTLPKRDTSLLKELAEHGFPDTLPEDFDFGQDKAGDQKA